MHQFLSDLCPTARLLNELYMEYCRQATVDGEKKNKLDVDYLSSHTEGTVDGSKMRIFRNLPLCEWKVLNFR
ncbi:unnamed protein product [Gongylonema pulchrum]|uniref:RFX-type winged-helix domain-containing protein n=1 Tax=Gongylonema pulchrum TaxID=637853 RepID=A0A183E5Y7_9BILA|nr:unnamed protein product [Gongylonema pulchrum]